MDGLGVLEMPSLETRKYSISYHFSPPPGWRRAAVRLVHRIWPSARFRTGLRAEGLSHDPEAVAAYKSDPLVHDFVSARLAVQMLDAGRWALAHATEIVVPMLLMHGTADPITSCDATCKFADGARENCTLKTWPGLLHELHWEREREEVVKCIIEWMQLRREDLAK